jgi:nitrogen fixation protein NifU and related proteins
MASVARAGRYLRWAEPGEEAGAEISGFKAMMVGEKEFPEMDDLAALKGVIQYPSRIKCATLAWTAFQNGLDNAEK